MNTDEQMSIEEQMKLYFGVDGIMENNFPGFRFRSQQLLLAENISAAFVNDSFLLAEVGTGVGKTFAYLLPAVLWAQESKAKVVISTRTKALQQQIVDRDLPDLTRIMNIKIKYAEAKGRENYLCWNKYMQILAGKKMLSESEQDFVQALLIWAEKTRSGDRKELELSSEAMQNWPIIAADRNSCLREQCRYQDKCFRMKMIRNINKADLIVVNHALLLSDVLIENREKSILPEYEYLIIDEAHTLIKESFDRMSYRFGLYEVKQLLTALHEKNRARGRKGYLLHIKATYPHLADLISEASLLTDRAISLTDNFFNYLGQAPVYGESYSYHHIIKLQDQQRPTFQKAIDVYTEWKPNTNLLLDKLSAINEELQGDEDSPELFSMITVLKGISDTGCLIMEENLSRNDDGICWLEYERGRVVAICSSPIYTGDSLDEKLYRNLNTLVMLSATMTVDNSFNNFINRSGLNWYAQDGRLSTLMETSPFDYQNNAALYIVEDMPDPASNRFGAELQRVLEEILLASGGRTMVLFTARKQMEEAAELLRPVLESHDLQLLVQNQDGEFASLMDGFANSEHAILMGLETFWEGIDLKGDLLKCLVIVKLPFRSPADPYCTAWDKYYRLQKMNSFEYFMLPDATIRLKQGVGRLIRSESDRGIVVVLDTRLIHKKYGQLMKNSLPLKNITAIKSQQLAAKIKEWM